LQGVDREEKKEVDSMNIAVLSCEKIKDATCLGCHPCLMGFDKEEGEFERYKGTDAKLRALLHCGGCPGTSPVLRLANLQNWMAPMGETIEGTHPYKPVRVFGG
jgi:CGGC domain